MNESSIKSIIAVISEQTAVNDHTNALVIASTLLDNLQGNGKSKATMVLIHAREIHHIITYMPSGLLEIRETYRDVVNSGLKRELSPELYELYRNAM